MAGSKVMHADVYKWGVLYAGESIHGGGKTEIEIDGIAGDRFRGTIKIDRGATLILDNMDNDYSRRILEVRDRAELRLNNSKLYLYSNSGILNSNVVFGSNNSLLNLSTGDKLNSATITGAGNLQLGQKGGKYFGKLRVLSQSAPFLANVIIDKGSELEINDRNVAFSTIFIVGSITNRGVLSLSDSIIANDITTDDNSLGNLYLYRKIILNDNKIIKQANMEVVNGTTLLGNNVNLNITQLLKVQKEAELLNPYSIISIRELSNYGTIDGKDGKYGNLNVRVANTGSIIQNDITLNGWDSYNSGFIESKGKFINNREVWTNINNTGSLTVNNAEFNGNIKQANLTVNGNAIQKADINLTKQLAVSNSGAITNNSNKIIADSLYNRDSISGDKSRANSIEVNIGSNLGGITQQNITIKGNFTNNGAIEAYYFVTTPNTNISGESGILRFNVDKNDGNITQKGITVSNTFENNKNVTANEYFYNAAGVKIKSDPLHSVQIAPGVKFVGNLPHEWQPYIAAQMVWNIIDETKFSVTNINFHGLSTKRYFQYGVGVQKEPETIYHIYRQ